MPAQTIDTALALRLEAQITKFEKNMKRASQVGEKTVTGLQRRFDNSNKKIASSAEKSAQTIGRELDRLRAKYDPVFKASKRYEAEVNELTHAHKIGAISAKQQEAALSRLNAKYASSTASADMLTKSNRRMTLVARGTGGGIQNVAFQVGDFATQVGAGTAASIALGQQLPQLLGGFGALGAVLGAVVAIGVPLASYLIKQGDASHKLTELTKKLEEATSDYRDAVRAATVPTEELTEKYGLASLAARDFLHELREISQSEAIEALDKQLGTIAGSFGGFTRENQGPGANTVLTAYEQTLQNIQKELKVTEEDAETLLLGLENLGAAKAPKEMVDAAADLRELMIETLGPTEDMHPAAKAIAKGLREAGLNAAEIVALMDKSRDGIQGAASDAGDLATKLGEAVSQMSQLANTKVSDLRGQMELDQIRLETVGDPVERAGRTAISNFRNQLGSGGYNLAKYYYGDSLDERESIIRRKAEEAEKLKLEADKADAAYNKLQKSITSGSDKIDPFSIGDNALLAAERNLEMLGKTTSEIARLNAKYAMLDEAKRRDVDLNQRSAKTNLTVAETIEKKAEQIAQLTQGYERAAERGAFFEDINRDIKDGLIDAIVEGDNFADTLKSVAKALAKAGLEAALFNSGPLAGGRSNSVGGIFGSLFSGLFGRGGMPVAGQVGLFSSGGYTGDGGIHEPKGVVHGGEYVIPKHRVRQIGLKNLERLHKGYAKGGLVGRVSASMLPGAGAGGQSQAGINVNIINNSDAKIQKRERKTSGGTTLDVIIDDAVSGQITKVGSKSRQAMQSQFSLSTGLARR